MSEMQLRDIKVPDLDDPLYAPYWEGTAKGRIMVQCCGDCGTRRWPPRYMCWNCKSLATEWREEKQTGTLYSWTVVGNATTKAYMNTPYVVAVVEIEPETPLRMIGYVADIDIGSLSAGQKLRARFVKAGPNNEMTLVHWEPDPEA